MPREFAHVGDIGVEFLFTFYEKDGVTPVNITGATTLQAKLEKRGGAGATWTLSIVDGPNGQANYVTASAGDLDIDGVWAAMGYAVLPDGTDMHYKKETFEILPVLSGS